MTSPESRTVYTSAHFDEVAATWDDNPHQRALLEAVAAAIRKTVPLSRDWQVLEYGCGTGVLGFLLAPAVREVVAADSSAGMLEQVRQKLKAHPDVRMTPLLLDLMRDPVPREQFDLVVTAMALHHVEDVEGLIVKLGGLVAEGGWLVVADLYAEDGSFHAPMKVPHNGFVPPALEEAVRRAMGKVDCQVQLIHRVQKNNREFDVFLLTAKKTA
jgi:ubiquinone/menaquinone biosynthesis C-methylase UbiE